MQVCLTAFKTVFSADAIESQRIYKRLLLRVSKDPELDPSVRSSVSSVANQCYRFQVLRALSLGSKDEA